MKDMQNILSIEPYRSKSREIKRFKQRKAELTFIKLGGTSAIQKLTLERKDKEETKYKGVKEKI